MRPLVAAFALFVTAAPLLAQPKGFFFQPNDRVVFLGDSITEQYQYSTYLELYLTTRFPKANFVFLNAGIGGDTAFGGANRFQLHVLDDKPTAVTINFGMNDAGYQEFKEPANKTYREKTEAMLKQAKAANVRVALCSPNAVDPRVSPGFSDFKRYLETQKQFYAPLKEIAEKNGANFADQYAVTRKAIEAMTKDDPKAEKAKPYYDGFHTSPPGGLLMAHAILTELKAPAVVSEAHFLTGKIRGKTAPNVGCKVEDVNHTDDGLTFTRTDDALPLPVQKDWRPMLPYTNQLNDLNYYGLTVAGLEEGKYDVLIDGVKVATFTAKELAAGVNLGNATSGPIYDHAQKVFEAINNKNNLVRSRFFDVLRFNPPGWVKIDDLAGQKKAEAAKRLPMIEKEQAKVFEVAQPKPHKWEVKAAK
ncbi:MAG: SGNH/GDSL hydrolase family protein [Fimbriiglobus sp.]|nr:SGNH/GDSL hydrolase family protein [Fimbriiglobus sp.]